MLRQQESPRRVVYRTQDAVRWLLQIAKGLEVWTSVEGVCGNVWLCFPALDHTYTSFTQLPTSFTLLQYLHRRQPMVIHRDLKLENVLLKGVD